MKSYRDLQESIVGKALGAAKVAGSRALSGAAKNRNVQRAADAGGRALNKVAKKTGSERIAKAADNVSKLDKKLGAASIGMAKSGLKQTGGGGREGLRNTAQSIYKNTRRAQTIAKSPGGQRIGNALKSLSAPSNTNKKNLIGSGVTGQGQKMKGGSGLGKPMGSGPGTPAAAVKSVGGAIKSKVGSHLQNLKRPTPTRSNAPPKSAGGGVANTNKPKPQLTGTKIAGKLPPAPKRKFGTDTDGTPSKGALARSSKTIKKKMIQQREEFSCWREEFIWETDKKYPEKIKEVKPMSGKNTIIINPEDETAKYKRGF